MKHWSLLLSVAALSVSVGSILQSIGQPLVLTGPLTWLDAIKAIITICAFLILGFFAGKEWEQNK